MGAPSEKILKNLKQLQLRAKQVGSSMVDDEEKTLMLINAIVKEALQNHLWVLDEEGIERMFSSHPYLLIQYMDDILHIWKEYSNWHHNNKKTLMSVSEYVSENFTKELNEFKQTIKNAEADQQRVKKIRNEIGELEAQMTEYATPEQIAELVGEKETKIALLKKLQEYKKEVDAGFFDELNAEIGTLSEKYKQKGQALEELKARKSQLSNEIDRLEGKLERTSNHAKLFGEAKEVLGKADREIQSFNRKIAQQNDVELRKIYVQLREDIEIGANQGHRNIIEELKIMKQRIDEIEEVFAETLGKK